MFISLACVWTRRKFSFRPPQRNRCVHSGKSGFDKFCFERDFPHPISHSFSLFSSSFFLFSSALRVSPSHSFSAMVSFDADIEQRNPDLEIAETPMRDWVKWDSGCSVSQYASRMAVRRLYCMLLMITCIDSNLRGR